MKIALGMRDFFPRKGGAERAVAELMYFLSGEGHEVHIFSHRAGKVRDKLFLHRVPAIPFPKSLKVLSFAWLCSRRMKKQGFDVTIGVGNTLEAELLWSRGGVQWHWFWRSLRAYQNPLLWGISFLGKLLSSKQWAEALVQGAPYKKARRIVAISGMVKEDILSRYRLPRERITVLYTGINTRRFSPDNGRFREQVRKSWGVSADEYVILFSAHNFRLKGLRYLLKAVALLKERKTGIKLVVLGRDRVGPYIRLAARLGCKNEVIFAGEIKVPEKCYPAADILVHPTFSDACSRVVLEALASGLPVITTKYNGAGGIISEGKEGFVLDDPRDVEVMVEKIMLLSDPERLRKSSLAARGLAEEYSREQSYQRMLIILEELKQ